MPETTLFSAGGDPRVLRDGFVPMELVQRLLESVELVDRRRAFLTVHMEEIGADGGFWTWGHGP